MQFQRLSYSGERKGQGHSVEIGELHPMDGNCQDQTLLPGNAVGVESASRCSLVYAKTTGCHVERPEYLEQDHEGGYCNRRRDGQLRAEGLGCNYDHHCFPDPAGQSP